MESDGGYEYMEVLFAVISTRLTQRAGISTDSCRFFHGRGKTYPNLDWLSVDFSKIVYWLQYLSQRKLSVIPSLRI